MQKLCWFIYGTYRKFEKSNILFISEKKTLFYITDSNCKNEDAKIFYKEESIEILKILSLIENI